MDRIDAMTDVQLTTPFRVVPGRVVVWQWEGSKRDLLHEVRHEVWSGRVTWYLFKDHRRVGSKGLHSGAVSETGDVVKYIRRSGFDTLMANEALVADGFTPTEHSERVRRCSCVRCAV